MQTKLHFSKETFNLVKLEYRKQEETKKDNEIKHLKRVISGFKGWKTKRNKF